MRKKLIWIAAALVLIAIPAAVGLVALRGDDTSSSARRAGALVVPGSATAYQLLLTQAAPTTSTPDIKEAFEIKDFSFGVENPTTIGSATGALAGKIKFNALKVKKTVDRASPLVFRQAAVGAHYKTAVLTLRKPGERNPYITYTMETVFVTNVDHGGSSPEVAIEQITFVFGRLTIESVDKNPDGSEMAPVQRGWDQITNTAHN